MTGPQDMPALASRTASRVPEAWAALLGRHDTSGPTPGFLDRPTLSRATNRVSHAATASLEVLLALHPHSGQTPAGRATRVRRCWPRRGPPPAVVCRLRPRRRA